MKDATPIRDCGCSCGRLWLGAAGNDRRRADNVAQTKSPRGMLPIGRQAPRLGWHIAVILHSCVSNQNDVHLLSTQQGKCARA